MRIAGLSPEARNLAKEIWTVGFPAVGAIGFSKRSDPGERRFPVGVAGRDAHRAVVSGPAQDVPAEAGETEDVVAFNRMHDVCGRWHQRTFRVLGAPPPSR